MIRRAWSAIVILCVSTAAEAARQPGKDGAGLVAVNTVVNLYSTLAADAPAGAMNLSASIPGGANTLDPTTLTASGLLLVIQMQGASIDSSNTANYGNVTNYNNAGLWEFVTVSGSGVGTGPCTIPSPASVNGFFHFPPFDSLAEAFVKAESKGAIAAFSPSGLSVNEPAHLYHKAFLAELTAGSHTRLGDALLAAQKAYADSGHMPKLLAIYHLFGDPGMPIR